MNFLAQCWRRRKKIDEVEQKNIDILNEKARYEQIFDDLVLRKCKRAEKAITLFVGVAWVMVIIFGIILAFFAREMPHPFDWVIYIVGGVLSAVMLAQQLIGDKRNLSSWVRSTVLAKLHRELQEDGLSDAAGSVKISETGEITYLKR